MNLVLLGKIYSIQTMNTIQDLITKYEALIKIYVDCIAELETRLDISLELNERQAELIELHKKLDNAKSMTAGMIMAEYESGRNKFSL